MIYGIIYAESKFTFSLEANMGCIGKFILTVLALAGFSLAGWITLAPGASLLWTAVLVIIISGVVDLLLHLAKVLVHLVALPLTILTSGVVALAVEGVFKYIGLYASSSLTGMFVLPWIFGALWWQALIIGFVFAVIGALSISRSSSD